MTRFVLIDQSLKGIGGHHYDYSLQLMRALADMNLPATLATHRAFRPTADFPRDCPIEPLFRHTVYNSGSEMAPQKRTRRSHRIAQERHIRHFCEDCQRLFQRRPLEHGDQVFLSTVSEIELEGLAKYLLSHPVTRQVDWHCQFHFNVFEGRPHEYGEQLSSIQSVRQRFARIMMSLRNHSVHFYNTSHELVEQYRYLRSGTFESLAYPISPVFHDSSELNRPQEDQPTPLRISLAGAVRREKGQRALQSVIEGIDRTELTPQQIRFVVQRKRRRRFLRPQLDFAKASQTQDLNNRLTQVEFVEHPLSAADYARLIRDSDVGLFLYHSRTYFARRAGVLGEFLARGIPVIVPAGCWLSRQIDAASGEYVRGAVNLAQQSSNLPYAKPIRGEPFDSPRSIVVKSGESVSFPLDLPPQARQIAIRAALGSLDDQAAFARVTLRAPGVEPVQHVLDSRSAAECSDCLLPIPAGATNLSLEIAPAFKCPHIGLSQLQARAIVGPSVPLSRVGLVYSNVEQVPRLIAEMANHYTHYRDTARAHAATWYQAHAPRRVIEQLLDRARHRGQAAA